MFNSLKSLLKSSKSGLYKNGKLLLSWKDLEAQYMSVKGNIIHNAMINAPESILILDEKITELFCLSDESVIKEIYLTKNIKNTGYALTNWIIENINIDPTNKYYSSKNGILYNKDKTTLIKYPTGRKDKEYIIDPNIKTIGEFAFANNRYIEKIELRDGVKQINENAFVACKNLKELIIPKSVEKIETTKFFKCENIKYLGTKEEFQKINGYDKLESFVFPNKIKFIKPKTLDELISEGYSFRDANKILKEQNKEQ